MPICVEERVAAPIEVVWSLVGDFSGLAHWHPLLQRCDVEQVAGNMVRTAHFAELWIKERLTHCDALEHRLEYTAVDSSDASAIGARVTIELTPNGTQSTLFRWSTDVADSTAARLADYYRLRIDHARTALVTWTDHSRPAAIA